MCLVHTDSVVGPVCELSCPVRAQEVTYTSWNGVWMSRGFDAFCLAFGREMSSLPLDEMKSSPLVVHIICSSIWYHWACQRQMVCILGGNFSELSSTAIKFLY